MSWLWGGYRQPQVPENFNDFLPNAPAEGGSSGGDNDGKDKKGGAMEAYRFDSSALERAAQSAKVLESSREYFDLLHCFKFAVFTVLLILL